ncbi:winged helix-turn-helix domain-containing protein [Nesterenkonia ebinurensis]|uniref:winged helix-turn-helix domain-containing protein n=1 Tax=Nesterenkonia ebinurensis TaxID=2608252 RepID=UPI00123D9450|nr:helix-turn-helix domain-containing protein [Nesterenkonia ebinurensis]
MSEGRSTAERFGDQARIKDVQALKAFAHPLRMQIMEYLNDREEATSTTLAKHLGESTGQTSYHLRQLAKYGFVKEVEGKGTARERWWRSGGLNIASEDAQSLAQQSPLLETLAERQVRSGAAKLLDYMGRLAEEDPEWVAASGNSAVSTQMTHKEMKALRDEVWDLIDKHTDAAKARREAGKTEGRRRVRLHFAFFPLAADDQIKRATRGDGQ